MTVVVHEPDDRLHRGDDPTAAEQPLDAGAQLLVGRRRRRGVEAPDGRRSSRSTTPPRASPPRPRGSGPSAETSHPGPHTLRTATTRSPAGDRHREHVPLVGRVRQDLCERGVGGETADRLRRRLRAREYGRRSRTGWRSDSTPSRGMRIPTRLEANPAESPSRGPAATWTAITTAMSELDRAHRRGDVECCERARDLDRRLLGCSWHAGGGGPGVSGRQGADPWTRRAPGRVWLSPLTLRDNGMVAIRQRIAYPGGVTRFAGPG